MLHVIMYVNVPVQRLCLSICLLLCIQFLHPWGRHNLRKQYASASRALTLPHKLANMIPSVGICSLALVFGSDLIWLPISDYIQLPSSNLNQLTVSYLIWLAGSELIRFIISDLIWLKVFDWIWLTVFDLILLVFNAFIFDSSHIIQVPLQSGFMESHIFQVVF